MDITDIILLITLSCTFVLGFGITSVRKDIEELKELINKKL